jgi:hypothetical protein
MLTIDDLTSARAGELNPSRQREKHALAATTSLIAVETNVRRTRTASRLLVIRLGVNCDGRRRASAFSSRCARLE